MNLSLYSLTENQTQRKMKIYRITNAIIIAFTEILN